MADGTVRCKQDWRPAGERRFGSFFPVAGVNQVAEVVAGHHHACARTLSGGVACWGRNMSGEVGGDDAIVRVAHQVVLPAPAAEIRVGETESCARMVTGSVWCWGTFAGAPRLPPREISALSRAEGIAVSNDAVCAISKEGSLRCATGANVRYEPLGRVIATQVVLSAHRGCAILSDASVRCFALDPKSQPTGMTKVASWDEPGLELGDVVQLAAGTGHACARKRDRTVWCWGRNDYGQLGNGSRETSAQPVQVAYVTDAIEIDAGGDRTCALRDKGIYCWGADLTGDGMYRALTGLADDPGPPGPNDSLVPERLRVPVMAAR
jgi:alpha-tubulin suppressor-like RCC1 family protein